MMHCRNYALENQRNWLDHFQLRNYQETMLGGDAFLSMRDDVFAAVVGIVVAAVTCVVADVVDVVDRTEKGTSDKVNAVSAVVDVAAGKLDDAVVVAVAVIVVVATVADVVSVVVVLSFDSSKALQQKEKMLKRYVVVQYVQVTSSHFLAVVDQHHR